MWWNNNCNGLLQYPFCPFSSVHEKCFIVWCRYTVVWEIFGVGIFSYTYKCTKIKCLKYFLQRIIKGWKILSTGTNFVWASLGTVSLDHIIPETWPSASHTKQLQEGMQQNKTQDKITLSVLCPKLLCNLLTRMLNSGIHRSFSEKTAFANWIMHNAVSWSVGQSSLIGTFTYVYKEGLVFWVTFLSLGTEPLLTLRPPIWLQKMLYVWIQFYSTLHAQSAHYTLWCHHMELAGSLVSCPAYFSHCVWKIGWARDYR